MGGYILKMVRNILGKILLYIYICIYYIIYIMQGIFDDSTTDSSVERDIGLSDSERYDKNLTKQQRLKEWIDSGGPTSQPT